VDLSQVRDAYSSQSQLYIDLFDGEGSSHEVDAGFISRHLQRAQGRVLDLGCGPGHWTAHLHQLGVEATGVDVVPEFIDHARAHHPGPQFRLGSMTDRHEPEQSAAGVLSWYSTIHLAPAELGAALAAFRRLLVPGGILVLGFFAGEDEVAAFDHAVATAYRWPPDLLAEHLAAAGFAEVERVQREVTVRPDRTYAAIAARAV
jgi:SAM-dependent methyltransferase